MAPGGAGTSEVAGVLVRPGLDVGADAVADVGVEPPGSVVIATEPPVVLTHAARPRHMTAVPTTRTGMPIPPTIVVPLGHAHGHATRREHPADRRMEQRRSHVGSAATGCAGDRRRRSR